MQKNINFNVIAEAFNLVKDRWQPFVVAGLCGVVAISLAAGIFGFLMMAIGFIGGSKPVAVILILPMVAIFMVLMIVMSSVFQAGLMNMGLKASRGESVEAADVLMALKNPVPFLVAGLLVGLAVSIGVMFCYVPGLIIAGLTMFTIPFMLDQKLAPVDAIKASVELLKPNWLMATIFFFVAMFVGNLGVYACYIGMLFTYPVAMVAVTLCYRDMVAAKNEIPDSLDV